MWLWLRVVDVMLLLVVVDLTMAVMLFLGEEITLLLVALIMMVMPVPFLIAVNDIRGHLNTGGHSLNIVELQAAQLRVLLRPCLGGAELLLLLTVRFKSVLLKTLRLILGLWI